MELLEETRFIIDSPLCTFFVILCGLLAGDILSVAVYEILNKPNMKTRYIVLALVVIAVTIQGVNVWQTEYHSAIYGWTLFISSVFFYIGNK